MTINVDDVCTHAELVAHVLSARALAELLPDEARGSSTQARQNALDAVLSALRRRSPPIRESDLDDVTDLKQAVILGTMRELHFAGIVTASEGDRHWAKWKSYRDRFDDEISGMSVSVGGGSEGAPSSFSVERR